MTALLPAARDGNVALDGRAEVGEKLIEAGVLVEDPCMAAAERQTQGAQ